ncbi:MAG: hypothetical protein IJF18_03270 [Oscillospiraceae bacterium]|nr:hypothetical protein [Oscillospiraceae bacterium]
MAKYTGTRCIVCSEKFTDEDDIVVCPECGTPYHRDCYKKEGRCVNGALHDVKGTWKPTYDVGDSLAEEKEDTVCLSCGCKNPPDSLFCDNCGFPLKSLEKHNERMRVHTAPVNGEDNPDSYNRDFNGGVGIDIQPFLINFSDPLCGYNPDEDFDGVRLCELADTVESNTHYFLPIFKRIKETGRSFSWNFPAMLFPELYFAYRKMPLIALAAWAIKLFSLIPLMLRVFSESDIAVLADIAANFDLRSTAFGIMDILVYVLDYALMFFCGGFCNSIYYKIAVKRTAKIKNSVPLTELRDTLRRKGGTSPAWLILFILLDLLPYAAIYMMRFLSVLTVI